VGHWALQLWPKKGGAMTATMDMSSERMVVSLSFGGFSGIYPVNGFWCSNFDFAMAK